MPAPNEPVDPLKMAAGSPDQQPTHHYRSKRGEITCRSCGAMKAHPIHYTEPTGQGEG